MLDNNLIKDYEICAITYTNKAVDSLKDKIYDATKKDIDVFTFHKLSLNIINKSNLNYSIVSDNLLEYIIDEFFYSKAFGNKLLLKYIYNIFHIYLFRTNYNYKRILKSNEYKMFKKTFVSVINYVRSNNLINELKSKSFNDKYYKEYLIIYIRKFLLMELISLKIEMIQKELILTMMAINKLKKEAKVH